MESGTGTRPARVEGGCLPGGALQQAAAALSFLLAICAVAPAETAVAGNPVPGNADYPNAGLSRLGSYEGRVLGSSEFILEDPEADCIYLGIPTGLIGRRSLLVKMREAGPTVRPIEVGTVHFPQSAEIQCGAIDPARGHAYVGLEDGSIHKISLGEPDAPPILLGSIYLESADGWPTLMAIDGGGGYGYVATTTVMAAPARNRIVKIALGTGNSLPVRVAAVDLLENEVPAGSMAVDPARGYFYVILHAPWNLPRTSKIAKFHVGPGAESPRRVGDVEGGPEDGVLQFVGLAAEGLHGFASLSAEIADDPVRIARIDRGAGDEAPRFVATAEIEDAVTSARYTDFDAESGVAVLLAYNGTSGMMRAVKTVLGGGEGAPSVVGSVPVTHQPAVIDPETELGEIAYLGRYNSGGARVASGADGEPPLCLGAFWPEDDSVEDYVSAAMDADGRYLYSAVVFGGGRGPGLSKFAIGEDGVPMPAGHGAFETADGNSRCMVLDPDGGHAFVGTDERLVKVAIGGDGEAPVRVSALDLPFNDHASAAIWDPVGKHAYVAVGRSNVDIWQVAPGAGSGAPELVASLDPSTVSAPFVRVGRCAMIDEGGGYGYFAGEGLSKIRLAREGRDFAAVAAIYLGQDIRCGAIDEEDGYAYLVHKAHENSFPVYKVRLGEGDEPPEHVSTAYFGEYPWQQVFAAVADPSGDFAYLCVDSSRIIRMRLEAGDAPPTFAGILLPHPRIQATLSTWYGGAVFDAVRGSIYTAAGGYPGTVEAIGVDTGRLGFVNAMRVTLPEASTVRDVRFFSHDDAGMLRFAIYGEANNRKVLLWQSPSWHNKMDEGEVVVPTDRGKPSSLVLAPGNYWLAWQTSTRRAVGSHSTGDAESGLEFDHPFGPFPPFAPARTLLPSQHPRATSDRWTMAITYERADGSVGTLWTIR